MLKQKKFCAKNAWSIAFKLYAKHFVFLFCCCKSKCDGDDDYDDEFNCLHVLFVVDFVVDFVVLNAYISILFAIAVFV